MKTIPLTQELFAVVDDEDYERLSVYNWHATRNSRKLKWYAARNAPRIAGKYVGKIRMHREILNAPDQFDVDHKDGDGLNNRRSNLRLATNTQNQQNRGRNLRKSATLYKGVRYTPRGLKHYSARIYQNGSAITVEGMFSTAEEAARAYDAKATELFGEFAKLNFPSNSESV